MRGQGTQIHEPAVEADQTGKGLNPLSPSEEAPLPVTTVGMGQPDAPSVVDAAEQSESGGGENVDHQSATTGEAGAASPVRRTAADQIGSSELPVRGIGPVATAQAASVLPEDARDAASTDFHADEVGETA